MPTNVEWLSDIKTQIAEFRVQYGNDLADEIAEYRTPMLEAQQTMVAQLTTEAGLIPTLLQSILTKQEQILLTLQSWDQLLQDVRANLEFINSNGALNAQNQQILTISAASACCEDVTPTEGVPADMCARARAVVDTVLNRADTLCGMATASTIPTLEELRDILRRDEWHSATAPMYTDSELVDLQGAIAARGMIGLSELCDIMNNTLVAERAYDTIFNAGNSQAAATAMAAQFFFDLGIPDPWDKFIRYLFPASVIDLVFNSNVTINTDNFSNEGCEPTDGATFIDQHDILISQNSTPTSLCGLVFSPTSEALPGWDYAVEIVSESNPGQTHSVFTDPDSDLIGNISSANPQLRITLDSSIQGLLIQWNGPTSGTNHVVFARKAWEPE